MIFSELLWTIILIFNYQIFICICISIHSDWAIPKNDYFQRDPSLTIDIIITKEGKNMQDSDLE